MEENKKFDNWYRNRITEDLTPPPADAWENISDELDTREVWGRISAELDGPGGWPFQKTLYYVVPIVALLFLSGTLYYYKTVGSSSTTPGMLIAEQEQEPSSKSIKRIPSGDNAAENAANSNNDTAGRPHDHDQGNDNKSVSRGNTGTEHLTDEGNHLKDSKPEDVAELKVNIDHNDRGRIASAEKVTDNVESIPVDTEDRVATEEPNLNTHQVQETYTDDLASKTNLHRSSEEQKDVAPSAASVFANKALDRQRSAQNAFAGRGTVVSLTVADSMLVIHPVETSIVPVYLQPSEDAAQDEKRSFQKSIEFGVTASAKNNWLLNRTTLRGLEKHTLTTTLPDFGKDLGMVLTYHFSQRWAFQAEGLLLSELGQRYQEYRNGKYVERQVSLRYHSMNLIIKYKRNAHLNVEPSNGHSFVGGIFSGRLARATERIDDRPDNHAEGYTQFNYGVLFGYEYNRYLLKRVVFTSGLRANYGFANIDAQHNSRTVTGSFDLNFALKYRIGL